MLVRDLPEQTEAVWIKGPPEQMRDRAAAGFARRHGVDPDGLEVRDGFLGIEQPGRAIRDVLPERIEDVVRGLTFSKTMRWDDSGLRYPRPLRWVLAKLDEETLRGEHTFGHRFTHGAVDIPAAETYAERLREALVEPVAAERRRRIVEALPEGWSDPAGVLDEVVHLVEWPTVLESAFDPRFLDVPRDVVITAMQSHQRYFPLEGNRFAFVANGGDPDVVRAGNTQVLENRLDDAAFSFERDVKIGIDGLATRLAGISFFEGGGTFADKAERLQKLVERLGGGRRRSKRRAWRRRTRPRSSCASSPSSRAVSVPNTHAWRDIPRPSAPPSASNTCPIPAAGPCPRPRAGASSPRRTRSTRSASRSRSATGRRAPATPLACAARRSACAGSPARGRSLFPRRLLEGEVGDFVEERYEGLLDVPVEFVRAARRSGVVELGQVAQLAQALARLDDATLDRLHTAYSRAERLAGRSGEAARSSIRACSGSRPRSTSPRRSAALAPRSRRRCSAGTRKGRSRRRLSSVPPVDRFFEDVLVMAEDSAVRANRLRLYSTSATLSVSWAISRKSPAR